MGCDIHVAVAKWDGENAELLLDLDAGPEDREDRMAWWTKWRPTTGRNYERFAALSAVRGEGREANGWPDWAKDLLPEWIHDADLHSHTHYPVRKAARLWAKTEGYVHDMAVMCKASPIAMYFGVDPNREDLHQIYVLIAYDN